MPTAFAVLATLAALVLAGARADLEISHTARALQPGEIVTLQVVSTTPRRTVEAIGFGRTAPLWPEGGSTTRWRGLIGLDVEISPGPQSIEVRATAESGGVDTATYTIDVLPKQFAERHLKVDPRFSDPPASVRPRIAREAARLEAIFAAIDRHAIPDVPFTAPVPQPSNSRFGLRSFFNKQPRGRHNGVDFPSPAGTSIRAPARGRVVLVDDLYFTGHTVVIDHGMGVYSLFAHLERTAATDAAMVERGEVVGFVGSTGRATGPHLHWSLRLQRARVDPLSLSAPHAAR